MPTPPEPSESSSEILDFVPPDMEVVCEGLSV
jgi:hypothetical protein